MPTETWSSQTLYGLVFTPRESAESVSRARLVGFVYIIFHSFRNYCEGDRRHSIPTTANGDNAKKDLNTGRKPTLQFAIYWLI
jgi:hypothetical protein